MEIQVLEYTEINGKKVPKRIIRKMKGKLPDFMTEPKKCCTFGGIYSTESSLDGIREFQIWIEGYAATGEHGTAQMIGKGFGTTFDEAVKDYLSKHPDCGIEENNRNRYVSDSAYQSRRSNWNIWACDLFDNETDARKSFG